MNDYLRSLFGKPTPSLINDEMWDNNSICHVNCKSRLCNSCMDSCKTIRKLWDTLAYKTLNGYATQDAVKAIEFATSQCARDRKVLNLG